MGSWVEVFMGWWVAVMGCWVEVSMGWWAQGVGDDGDKTKVAYVLRCLHAAFTTLRNQLVFNVKMCWFHSVVTLASRKHNTYTTFG